MCYLHTRAPNLGTSRVFAVLVTQSRASTIVALNHIFPISDGYVVDATTTFDAHRGASDKRNHVLHGIPIR